MLGRIPFTFDAPQSSFMIIMMIIGLITEFGLTLDLCFFCNTDCRLAVHWHLVNKDRLKMKIKEYSSKRNEVPAKL